mgnify:CR=1 FL=1
MRQDQWERLAELEERLAEVVISDADPQHWIGNGRRPGELTKDERGDAYWCRKQAAASISVLMRVVALREGVQGSFIAPPAPEGGDAVNMDAELAAVEGEAQKLMDVGADSDALHRELPERLRKIINGAIGTEDWPEPVVEVLITSLAMQG